jgi:hypothetical protein
MALVPMNQTVTISRGGDGVDDWGNPLAPTTFTVACSVNEGSEVVQQLSGGLNSSETAIARAKILFDKLADIRYTDEISFTNELGETITRKPKEINVKRMNGKPLITEVFI